MALILPLVCVVNVWSVEVRITGGDAVSFGSWVSGSLMSDDTVCVYRDDAVDDYWVTVTDNSTLTPGAFHLENQSGTAEIPYSVKWNNSAAAGGVSLVYGVKQSGDNAALDDSICSIGGDTSNIRLEITSSDLEAAPAGSYSTEIEIFIEPR